MSMEFPKRHFVAYAEYGVLPDMREETYINASSLHEAKRKAIKHFKRSSNWDSIGEHNVYVRELD